MYLPLPFPPLDFDLGDRGPAVEYPPYRGDAISGV